jgi:hypothetical protein
LTIISPIFIITSIKEEENMMKKKVLNNGKEVI